MTRSFIEKRAAPFFKHRSIHPDTLHSTRHRQTRLGWQVVLVAVFCMLGAALQGLNLLVVLAAVLLGALIVQWRVARTMIDWVEIQRRFSGEWFAGTPTIVRYHVTNRHFLIPAFLIRIEDTWTRLQTRNSFRAATAIARLRPRGRMAASMSVTIQHRGRYKIGDWRVSTIAPLGLSVAWRDGNHSAHDRSIDVFPRLVTLAEGWQRRLPNRDGHATMHVQRHGESNDEFFGLREYRRGDSQRNIHWRTTARIGKPAVRQHEQQRQFKLCVLVDAFLPSDSEPARENVERAISLAATMIIELSGGLAGQLSLSVAAKEIDGLTGGSSGEGLRRMLRTLARIESTRVDRIAVATQTAVRVSRQLPDLIVISPRSQSAVLNDAKAADALKPWIQRRRLTWIDVSAPEVNRWMVTRPADDGLSD